MCCPNLKKTVRSKSGFTLIELLLVLAILAFISLMGNSFYSRFLTQNAVANTVDQLSNQLRKAQIYAMMGKQNSAWGVNFSANKIVLFKGTALGQDSTFNEEFSVNPNISMSGFTQMSFARFSGLPTPVGPTTVIISGNSDSKTVTINQYGVVSD